MNNRNPDPNYIIRFIKPLQTVSNQAKEEKLQQNVYDKVKVFAVYHLITQVLHQIDLKLFILETHSYRKMFIFMPHNAFMWTKEDWLERLQYGSHWLKTLRRVENKAWLEQRKLLVDFRQLHKIAAKCLTSYVNKEGTKELLETLQSINEYNNIEETIKEQMQSNELVLTNLKRYKDEFDKISTSILKIKELFIRANLEHLMTYRTKNRYVKSYNAAAEDQTTMEGQIICNKLIEQRRKYEIRMKEDIYMSASKLDFYYNSIEKLRIKIRDMSEYYAHEDEKANEKRQLLLTSIEKDRINYVLMQERLALYKKGIELHKSDTNIASKELQEIDILLYPKKYLIDDSSRTTSMFTLSELGRGTLSGSN